MYLLHPSPSSKTDCDDCRSQFEKESYPNLKANTLTTCIPIQLSYSSLYIVTGVHQSLEIEGIFRFMVGGYLWIHPKSVFAKLRSPILSNPPGAPLWTEHIHHGSNFSSTAFISARRMLRACRQISWVRYHQGILSFICKIIRQSIN